MASKDGTYEDEKGTYIWRTVGGRKIKIYTGQSLSDAMIQSGKFKNLRSDYRKAKEEDAKKETENEKVKNALKNDKKDFKINGVEDTGGGVKVYSGEIGDYTFIASEDGIEYFDKEQGMTLDKYLSLEDDAYTGKYGEDIKGAYDYEQKYAKFDVVPKDIEKEIMKKVSGGEIDTNNLKDAFKKEEKSETYPKAQGGTKFSDLGLNVSDEKAFSDYLRDKYGTDDFRVINFDSKEGAKKIYDEFKKGKTFTQKLDMHGGEIEYDAQRLKEMENAGVKPMEHSYTGGGWEGVNSNKNLDTKDQAKAITDSMKKQFPDVKISRKSNLFSGGSSIDFNIMSSDKDLFVSDSDIDKMGYEDLHDVSRSNGFEWWAKDNVPNYNENHSYSIDDVRTYAKKSLAERKTSDIQGVTGKEWYLNDYGKNVVSELNKQANSYTYDDSDGMVDYFDHGTYMHISIGKWNKPYQVNVPKTMNDKIRTGATKTKGGFYTKKDGTKEYDPYKGTPYEKKYDGIDDAINDPNSNLNKYMNNKLQQKAYKKYMKEHPNSSM